MRTTWRNCWRLRDRLPAPMRCDGTLVLYGSYEVAGRLATRLQSHPWKRWSVGLTILVNRLESGACIRDGRVLHEGQLQKAIAAWPDPQVRALAYHEASLLALRQDPRVLRYVRWQNAQRVILLGGWCMGVPASAATRMDGAAPAGRLAV